MKSEFEKIELVIVTLDSSDVVAASPWDDTPLHDPENP